MLCFYEGEFIGGSQKIVSQSKFVKTAKAPGVMTRTVYNGSDLDCKSLCPIDINNFPTTLDPI